jgi:phosphatidylglycerol---prolipoprotein diacylglyceryl transferase
MHPILFHLGPITVRSYGVLLITGFLLGLWRGMRVLQRRMVAEPEGSPRRISPDQLFDVAIVGLLLGIVGARILFVILNWAPSAESTTSFASHPIDAFKIWEGGLSLHGGLIAGVLFLWWWTRRHKVSMLALADVCAPSWALAYVFGRIGCFLNGCCYGGVCDPGLPWAMRFHDEHYANAAALTPPSHPTQLYAVLFNIVFFVVLSLWERKPRRDGELFFAYIAMYGFYRYIVDIFRVGGTSSYLSPHLFVSLAQLASVAMIVLGVGGVVWLRKNRPAVADAVAPPIAGAAVTQ